MRMHAFHRTELLIGQEGYAKLAGSSVLVVGLGGVGSYVAEALARSGVGHLTIVDFDRVCLTNLNRQIHATRQTVGQVKAELMAERIRAISPSCDLRALPLFYSETTRDQIFDRPYDAVVDCIDNMQTKLDLLETSRRRGLATFAAMGAGSRLDPTQLRVSDLSETHTDPLSRIVRKQLRQRGIESGIVCAWSTEPPVDLDAEVQEGFRCICPDRMNSPASCDRRFQVQGTVAWMPAMLGLTLAGAVGCWLAGRPLPYAQPSTEPLVPADGDLAGNGALTGERVAAESPTASALASLAIRSL